MNSVMIQVEIDITTNKYMFLIFNQILHLTEGYNVNKVLGGVILSFFCLGSMQEYCLGLGLGLSAADKAAKQQREQHDIEAKVRNKETMRAFNKDVRDLKKEQKKERDALVEGIPIFKGSARYAAWCADKFMMPLAIARKTGKTDSSLLFEQVKSWGEYVKVLSKYCSKVIRHKLPISGKKLDKDAAAVIRPLIEFANALVKGKATEEQKNKVLDIHVKLTKTDWDMFAAAIVGLVDLINNNLNDLPEKSRQLAELAKEDLTNKFNVEEMRKRIIGQE